MSNWSIRHIYRSEYNEIHRYKQMIEPILKVKLIHTLIECNAYVNILDEKCIHNQLIIKYMIKLVFTLFALLCWNILLLLHFRRYLYICTIICVVFKPAFVVLLFHSLILVDCPTF